MKKTFNQWKTQTMLYLLDASERSGDEKMKVTIESLIVRLENLKVRWLSGWLTTLYLAAKEMPELLKCVPSEEDVEEWFKKEE